MLPDEPERGPGFTIVDRRGSQGEPETPPKEHGPLPQVDFAAIVLSFASSALFHLGLVPDPETGQPGPKSLSLAQHSIDLLELLQRKTQGNLTPEEGQLLTNLLTELRVRFVESSRGA
jgi:Domain of unknown function (DUF1844)